MIASFYAFRIQNRQIMKVPVVTPSFSCKTSLCNKELGNQEKIAVTY